ncbi:P-loop NTPase fold protein [Streptomyces sp. DSM 44915]|uniref:P-loop NTPase fold protein n=1 Tax=Streptomyces chisholmiae TaxID=3075540 RepID=A0ABU2JZK4_9ACTN|nr:P-loop NTPase fold protein [Streptomyces sp. DSM 44915]MDT0270193.1 P-loop NTPase fold protein [Streptomyces sp. DSM 44915]
MAERDSERFTLLSDEPVATAEADLLGAGRAAKRLAALLVASREATPLTLTVDGGWGTGKSSLMRLVDAELTRSPDVHTVWYNAWTATGTDALEGIIKSVLTRFDRRALRRALAKFTEHRALVRVLRSLALLAAGPLGVAGLADALWRSLSATPESRNEMRDAIRELATEWAEATPLAPRRLLVVFIDDLDRCSAETVLAIGEAVKVYLDVPGLAFVIGCDRSALTPGGMLRDLTPAGSAFMDKILQTSYRIPGPGDADIEEFVSVCAHQSGIRSLLDADLAALLAERSGRNPRSIKKLVNGFVLEMTLNPLWRDFQPRIVDAVVRVLLLQDLYPDFYRMLVRPGASHGDVVAEFRAYRQVRRVLRQLPDDDAGPVEVADFFTRHEMRPPSEEAPDTWADSLVELESLLPADFPALAADRGFTSLIEDLMELPHADKLIRQLRQQPPARNPPPTAYPHLAADPSEAEASELLRPTRILWVDDSPENIEFEAEQLRWSGAQVTVVRSRSEAERQLRAETPALLISDVTRGPDQQAGFTDVAYLRANGGYSGPVIFYTSRVTPARKDRAGQLGALGITDAPAQLHRLVRQATHLPSTP